MTQCTTGKVKTRLAQLVLLNESMSPLLLPKLRYLVKFQYLWLDPWVQDPALCCSVLWLGPVLSLSLKIWKTWTIWFLNNNIASGEKIYVKLTQPTTFCLRVDTGMLSFGYIWCCLKFINSLFFLIFSVGNTHPCQEEERRTQQHPDPNEKGCTQVD